MEEGGRYGGMKRGKEVRREGTRAKPGNQLVLYKADLLKFVGIPYSLGYICTRSTNFLACFLH